jgi:transcriptional regulator with XRE-family HTH domain
MSAKDHGEGMISPMRPDAVKSAALLREARLRAGLSQVALAELSGKDRVQLGRYEAGTVAPSFDTVVDIVRACGFDLPLELVPLSESAETALPELLRLSPERRLERMLTRIDQGATR